uniref:Uncharacterized protein n=1 Tax=Timema genevievae TaxID=629358 RepID=A0A7R9JTZ0_TIMGE|nr:unnamed protein product [Timema genevievae]
MKTKDADWLDSIRIDLKEIVCNEVDWIELASNKEPDLIVSRADMGLERLNTEEVYPQLLGRKVKNDFVESTISTPHRDSNLDLHNIGNPVYYKSSVLDH